MIIITDYSLLDVNVWSFITNRSILFLNSLHQGVIVKIESCCNFVFVYRFKLTEKVLKCLEEIEEPQEEAKQW